MAVSAPWAVLAPMGSTAIETRLWRRTGRVKHISGSTLVRVVIQPAIPYQSLLGHVSAAKDWSAANSTPCIIGSGKMGLQPTVCCCALRIGGMAVRGCGRLVCANRGCSCIGHLQGHRGGRLVNANRCYSCVRHLLGHRGFGTDDVPAAGSDASSAAVAAMLGPSCCKVTAACGSACDSDDVAVAAAAAEGPGWAEPCDDVPLSIRSISSLSMTSKSALACSGLLMTRA